MTAQQLKASILQLAIQGKLVPQNPVDEPASVLLRRIKAEKDVLVKAGKLKKDKHESVIIRNENGRFLEKKDGKTTDITDEIPFDIPDSWEWARLKSFADSCLGKMLDAQKNKGSLMPYLRNVNVRWHSFDLSDLLQMRFEQDELERYEVIPGDLIVCEGGEPGRCAVWTEKTGRMRIQKALHRIRPFHGISSSYLAYVIQLYSNNKYLSGFFTGTTIKHLTGKALDNLLFPLPSQEEQARIVAKIEVLLPHVEEYGKAETALSKLNTELPEQLKKSILQWAIQGHLVPQDPTDEPASELLKRIKAEKAALIKSGKIKKEKPLPPISEDEIPFDIPESWIWVRCGDVFQHNTGKALNSTNRNGRLLEYITTSNLYWNRFELDKLREMFFTDAEIEKCNARKGDLLVCEGGDYGRAAIWNFNRPICIQNHIHRLRSFAPVSTKFFYYLFLFYKSAGLIGGKGIGIQGLSSNALHALVFPLPPLAEQKRIVDKLETVLIALGNKS
jgi:type I restriction enzyme S subunit